MVKENLFELFLKRIVLKWLLVEYYCTKASKKKPDSNKIKKNFSHCSIFYVWKIGFDFVLEQWNAFKLHRDRNTYIMEKEIWSTGSNQLNKLKISTYIKKNGTVRSYRLVIFINGIETYQIYEHDSIIFIKSFSIIYFFQNETKSHQDLLKWWHRIMYVNDINSSKLNLKWLI